MLKNLRSLRDAASVSQKQLADAIGISQQSINKYENHNIEPDIGTLIRIADFFNTSVDYLIGNTTVLRKLEETIPYELNATEQSVVDGFRKLSAKQKLCVLNVIDSYDE